jgi:hypothetical protein
MDNQTNVEVAELKNKIEELEKKVKSANECIRVLNSTSKTTTDVYEVVIKMMKSRCTCNK